MSTLLARKLYPELLGRIHQVPKELYFSGDKKTLEEPLISIVGSRRMTPYGKRVCDLLVPGLVEAGIGIVSGLAFGIDSQAHRVALEHQGRCIAVLGSGLDQIYPRQHQSLADQIIAAGGCILSEYPDTLEPTKYSFPARNRIIAGLSPMTIIIEAGVGSGSLITAQLALDENRGVGVVPGEIDKEQSQGINQLLRQGAIPITSIEDLQPYYPDCQLDLQLSRAQKTNTLTGEAAALYDLISQGKETIEELLLASGQSLTKLQHTLTVLELDGYINRYNTKWQKIS